MTTKKPVLQASGHPDNFQTPEYAIDSIVPFIKSDWRIWEPACGKGNLLRAFHKKGFSCTGTDITQGNRDFLNFTISGGFDCIITNPPFSIKEQFLARCYSLGKPFALLLPISTFDSKKRRELFHRNGIQVIMPNGRISFETPNGKGSSAWFYTCWFTWGLNLPSQIVFDDMPNGTGGCMMDLPLINYAESMRLRDMGMNIAASADNDWLGRARSAAEMLAASEGETNINAVYAVVGLPDHPNCAGSVFLPRKKWECIGYQQSARIKRRAGMIRRWCLRVKP